MTTMPTENQEQGYCCAVCHGWEATRDEILRYLALES